MIYELPKEPIAGICWNFLFPVVIWLGRRFGRTYMYDHNRIIVQVRPSRLVKGPCDEAELQALQFVAAYTSIPVPKVHRTYRRAKGLFLEMEFINGVNLETAWIDGGLSDAEKKAIVSSIASYVDEMRALEPPDGFAVGTVHGGRPKDVLGRIPHSITEAFNTVADFHGRLRGNVALEECAEIFGQDVYDCHQRDYRTVFAHADLNPRNVILDRNKVPVIIDWELSGWWPEYWEYTKCFFSYFTDLPGWLFLVDQTFQTYTQALNAERAMWGPGQGGYL